MSTTYAQKQAPTQKKDAPTASAVLDSSSQSEGLQRKADMVNGVIQCHGPYTFSGNKAPDRLKRQYPILSSFEQLVDNGDITTIDIRNTHNIPIGNTTLIYHWDNSLRVNTILVYLDPSLGTGSNARAFYKIGEGNTLSYYTYTEKRHGK